MNRVSSRIAPLVFGAVFALSASFALLPTEFSHYKRWLEIGPDEIALRFAVLASIHAKTLLVLFVGGAIFALGARFLRATALRSLALATMILLFGFLCVDLELQKITGNNFSQYFPYLLDPDTFVWAGQGFDARPGLLRVAKQLLVGFIPSAFLAWGAERWVAGAPGSRGRAVLGGLGVTGLAIMIIAPLLQSLAVAPVSLFQLQQQMPWTLPAPWNSISTHASDSEEHELQSRFDRALPFLTQPRSFVGLLDETQPTSTPDILIVAVESLRHDVLTPDTMPHVSDWSERGLRLDAHYATSNASHYGLFALLYGRSPLDYFETLNAEEPPTLPSVLKEWGYTTHYVSCTDIRWREMDRFMGEEYFSVERVRNSSRVACDRNVATRATELLEPGDRAPRLVLAFLMSTHFGYHYPTGLEPFRPSLSPPNAIELAPDRDRAKLMNRYRNSAHYVDSLIGAMLENVRAEHTLVVVTGDHGESLFDDGTLAHSSLLSEIQTRVPFVMTGPGVSAVGRRRVMTDHSDVVPTILARLGVEPGSLAAFPGRDLMSGKTKSFVSLVQAKARAGPHDRIVLASHERRYALRMDIERRELRLLGKSRLDDRLSRDFISESEGQEVAGWLDEYLTSLESHSAPNERGIDARHE